METKQIGALRLPGRSARPTTTRSEVLDGEDVIDLLRAEIAAAGSQSEWARKNRVGRVMLNAALSGHRNMPSDVLEILGLEKVTMYRRVVR
jgi:hypothetical protein